ncbi:MAG: hypothetical protein NXH97_09625 [Rhodobacteraceae bacterium]|nr:hypothetical protein [Paracoccaceae bacterium]
MSYIIALAFLVAIALTGFADQAIGVARVEIDADRDRPLDLSIWYPAAGGHPEEIGGNAVFRGPFAAPNARIAAGSYPLVVMLHGGLRSANGSGAWLGAALAQAGFVVVDVNGPRPNSAEAAVNEIWRRPGDVSRALDLILTTGIWADHIDTSRISVLGFALGGTAALAIAGAEIDVQRYMHTCDEGGAGGPDCAWFAAQGIALENVDQAELARSRRDFRFASAVAISPEYVELFLDGTASIEVPVRLIFLGDEDRPSDVTDPRFIDEVTISSARVFDGFPICTEAGPAILSEDDGDPAMCGVSADARKRIHGEITRIVTSFLTVAAE